MRGGVLLLVGAALVGAFFLGRLTHSATAAPAKTTARGGDVFTAAFRDVVRIPSIQTRCVVSEEAGFPNLLCDHSPRGRYELVLFRDSLLVYRNGDPDRPRFAARWNP